MDFKLKKYWYVLVLLFILLFSYYIRALNIVPDRLLSYDPIFQYRFTKYLVDWDHLPLWDELSYYTGRLASSSIYPPFMWYITAVIYFMFSGLASLTTIASYASAIYGALIVIPAFLLGRELSNKYGGLFAAALIGTAPQILTRTFGSSYDTDQFVLLFIILTLYSGLVLLRRKTIPAFCLTLISFSGFMLTWKPFPYTYIILCIFVVFYFLLNIFLGIRKKERNFLEVIKNSFNNVKPQIIVLIVLFIGIFIVGYLSNSDVIGDFLGVFSFAQSANEWIVNISIAELQPIGDIWIPISATIFVSILSMVIFFRKKMESGYIFLVLFLISITLLFISGYVSYNSLSTTQKASTSFLDYLKGDYFSNISLPLGRFILGEFPIDVIITALFLSLISFAIVFSFKKDLKIFSFVLVLFLVSIYTTESGVRFTEYTSAFFLVIVAIGFGYLLEKSGKDYLFKSSVIGMCIVITLIALGIGAQTGKSLGPDINANWDEAWTFLQTKTPELSLVGTWWDPGHMITGLAERRVIADGAHCGNECMYTINDRIVDLGKIMVTSDENESLNLVRKYQGDSPAVYWIASDDLIGKFQWLQYFGTGCDARVDQSCPLYMQIPINQQGNMVDSSGNVVLRSYPLGTDTQILIYNGQIPIPIYIQGINAVLFNEIIVYNGTQPVSIKLNESQLNDLITSLKPLETQLNVRFSNQTIPMTVWIPDFPDYIVVIPPNLRDAVFTKMFFLEGQGLDHFKEVFRNDEVKIFEVV